jgi:serine/threonine-protein kinase
MEYVHGSTLAEIRFQLEHHGLRFPRSVVCDVGIAVAEALYCAWNAQDSGGKRLNIVHRDLKPANVLLSRQGVIKVGDFGIAKAASDTHQTQGRRVKGTPSYMPPEMMRGSRDFRPSMDLWSLGVMLWEMCTGHRFYGRVALHELLRKLDSRTAEEEAAAVASYFPAVAPVLLHLLRRDPADRYQDPIVVARHLRTIRAQMGPAPSLVEFCRLVRGRRPETGQTATSEVLPESLDAPDDWGPIMELARTTRAKSEVKPIRLLSDIREALESTSTPGATQPTESAPEEHYFEINEVEVTHVAPNEAMLSPSTDLRTFAKPRRPRLREPGTSVGPEQFTREPVPQDVSRGLPVTRSVVITMLGAVLLAGAAIMVFLALSPN